jgi:hypothetical protein
MSNTNTTPEQTMPKNSAERKNIPLCSGVLDYFPAALAEVAKLSNLGNDKHNPGQPLHWARGKSMDHADCIARHLVDRGVIDPDTGLSHTVEVAWRALALLQEECEAKGAPVARGAWVDAPKTEEPRDGFAAFRCLECGVTDWLPANGWWTHWDAQCYGGRYERVK